MHRSTSKSSTTPPEAVPARAAQRPFPVLLTVDVEEWYHNCFVPEYVEPQRRPPLLHELDRTLPALLELLAGVGARATLFVLGEVAARFPARVREAAAAGHEIACHGDLHLRANDRSPAEFRADIERAKGRLEDLLGAAVAGFRAPEWSLRRADNPRLRTVAEVGFAYDSSLAPALGAGSRANPALPVEYRWPDGRSLLELPPLVWGGALRLPLGGWCGRSLPVSWALAAIDRCRRAGGAPVLVVHPWELVEGPVPGLLTGFARFFHDAGRDGFRTRFVELLAGLDARPLAVAVELAGGAHAGEEATAELTAFTGLSAARP